MKRGRCSCRHAGVSPSISTSPSSKVIGQCSLSLGRSQRCPLNVHVEQGPGLRNHINCSEGCMLRDLITVPTDFQSEVLPLPADMRGGEPASAWTTPSFPGESLLLLPSTYLLFCPPPLLNSFNFAFKTQARVDHTPSESWRRKWQPTPVFLPGESCGRGSLVGCCPWDHTESDTTEEAT